MNKLAQAGTIQLNPGGEFSNIQNATVPNIISNSITIILIVAAIVFFFMLIWGGIRWILAGGDKANTEAARGTVTSALIGLIIVFSAWAIAQLLSGLFGINIFTNLTIPDFVSGGEITTSGGGTTTVNPGGR